MTLKGTDWDNWKVQPLTADASPRRYARLIGPTGQTVIHMNSGPVPTEPFVHMANHLRAIGLSAPSILWSDPPHLVLDDLGTTDLAQALDAGHDCNVLYDAVVDVLLHVARADIPSGLTHMTADRAAQNLDPLFDFYAPDADPAPLRAGMQTAYQNHCSDLPHTLALRDCHVENLIWRDDQSGLARIGLLDFQDAEVWPVGYDLASLLRDARRTIPDAIVQRATTRFCAGLGLEPTKFELARRVLGIQRNLRILGIFSRLITQDGRTHYGRYLPITWQAIQADLDHPALSALKQVVSQTRLEPAGAA